MTQLSPESSRNSRRSATYPLYLAAAAVVIGGCLRGLGLSTSSLWLDEAMTARRISAESFASMLHNLESSPFPPMYYGSIYAWTKFTGSDEFGLRSFSALMGVIGIVAAYTGWSGIIGAPAAARLATLVSLNAFHVFYSRDAKMYAAAWLFSILSCSAYLHVILKLGRPRLWSWVLSLSTVSLLMTSYTGAAILAVQGIHCAGTFWLASGRRRDAIRAAAVIATSLIPCSVWAQFAASAATNRTGLGWIPDARLGSSLHDAYVMIVSIILGFRPISQESGFFDYLLSYLCLVTFAMTTILVMKPIFIAFRPGSDPVPHLRHSEHKIVTSFLILWLILPFAACLVFSLLFYSLWGIPRYFSVVAPSFLVLIALGLSHPHRIQLFVGFFLIISNAYIIAFERTHDTRMPWRLIVTSIAREASREQGTDFESAGPVAVCLLNPTGVEDERMVLYYATSGRVGPSELRVSFLNWTEAAGRDMPFFVVSVARRGSAEDVAEKMRVIGGGRPCRRLSLYRIYDDGMPPLPSPISSSEVTVWLVTPLLRDRVRGRTDDGTRAANEGLRAGS